MVEQFSGGPPLDGFVPFGDESGSAESPPESLPEPPPELVPGSSPAAESGRGASLAADPGHVSATAPPAGSVSGSSDAAPSPVPSDRVLLSRAARGAADAFEQLYDRWAPVAYGMCVHVSGDETRAARAMESVWLEFWQNAPSLARRADDVRRVLADLVWAHARN